MFVHIVEYAVLGFLLAAVCSVVTSMLAYCLGCFAVIGGGILSAIGELHPAAVLLVAWMAVVAGTGVGYLIGRRMTQWPWVPKIVATLSGSVDMAKIGQRVGEISRAGVRVPVYKYYSVVRSPIPITLGAMQYPTRKWALLILCTSVWVLGTLFLAGFAIGKALGELLSRQSVTVGVQAASVLFGLVYGAVYVRSRVLTKKTPQ
jgi:membrane protein DedA with SNARE-associated domain